MKFYSEQIQEYFKIYFLNNNYLEIYELKEEFSIK